jgi:hypothetical protein
MKERGHGRVFLCSLLTTFSSSNIPSLGRHSRDQLARVKRDKSPQGVEQPKAGRSE